MRFIMLVRYRYLKDHGIVNDRMALARAIEKYNFPRPVALGENTLAWDLSEIESWLASRPRRAPKTGAKKPAQAADTANVEHDLCLHKTKARVWRPGSSSKMLFSAGSIPTMPQKPKFRKRKFGCLLMTSSTLPAGLLRS